MMFPARLDDALGTISIGPISLGASIADVEAILGEPRGRRIARPQILKYGDIEFTFDEQERCWLMAVWLVAHQAASDRFRDDLSQWSMSRSALQTVLSARFAVSGSDEDTLTMTAYYQGRRVKLHVAFDHDRVEKLSLWWEPHSHPRRSAVRESGATR